MLKKILPILFVMLFSCHFLYSSAGDEPAGTRGTPPIISAIYKGNLRLIAYYIRKGHSPNVMHTGLTAIQHAITTGNLRVIRFLVAKGARVNKRNAHGKTALQFARQLGNRAVIRYIRSVGGR